MLDRDEILRTVRPGEDIPCRTCKYKLEPVVVMGVVTERYNYGVCHVFQNKPMGILFRGQECELYAEE